MTSRTAFQTSLAVLAAAVFIALGGSVAAQPATPTPAPSAMATPTVAFTPTATPTFGERYSGVIAENIIAPLIVLAIVAALGAVGTYLFKPRLDQWLESRRQARQAQEERLRAAEQARQQEQVADANAKKYLENLVGELRNVKILDMTRALDLERTYIQLQVREESRVYARPEEETELARAGRDPNEWLALHREWREQRIRNAVSPEDALRQHRRCAVLGDPGAGKTTMLRHLALCSARGALAGLPAFPVLISLHRFVKSDSGDLLDFAANDLAARYGLPDARPYLEAHLEAGQVLVLLDGLDEVNVGRDQAEAEAHYQRAVEQINALSTRYRQAPIVVTSRLAGWRGGLAADFHNLEILDLGPDEIRQFIENWFGERPEKALDLERELSRSARIATMAANPLLLALICIVYQKDLELPERRARLYERCVHVLLIEWDAHREIRRIRAFTTDRKRDLLQALAWHFHCQGRRYFPQEELLDAIANFLPKIGLPAEQSGAILDEIAAQHGLLKEQAIGWYGFIHLTLQEYFAAREARQENQLPIVLANLHRPWWEEVTLLLASLGDAAPLLRGILDRPEDIFDGNLRLAGRCLVGRPRVNDPTLYQDIQDRLRRRLRQAELPTQAEQLARVLAELGGPENNAFLLDLLGEEKIHEYVRGSIADALGALGERSVAPRLLDLLGEEKIDWSVRGRIADALGALGERSVAPRLLDLLGEEKIKESVRWRIADALGALGASSEVAQAMAALWPHIPEARPGIAPMPRSTRSASGPASACCRMVGSSRPDRS